MLQISLTAVLAAPVVLLCTTFPVVYRQPAIVRILCILPCVACFGRLPLEIHRLTLRGTLGFMLGWLSNAKLLAFAAHRGPLSHPGLSHLQFMALLLLPVHSLKAPKGSHDQPGTAHLMAAASTLPKALAMGTLTVVVTTFDLPPPIKHMLYAIYIYLLVSLMLDSLLPLAQGVLLTAPAGSTPLQLQPSMRAPFLAKSVKEFWGWRYNQVVSATLSDCVFQPIVEGRWVAAAEAEDTSAGPNRTPARKLRSEETRRLTPPAPPAGGAVARPASRARKALALVAAFAVSGLMHELMIWYMCRSETPSGGRLMLFFLAQPVLIWAQEALESPAAALCSSIRSRLCRSQLQRRVADGVFGAVQVLVTLGAMLVCGELWFWQSFETGCKIDKTGLAEVMDLIHWARGAMQGTGV